MTRRFHPSYRVLQPDTGIPVEWAYSWDGGMFVPSGLNEWSCGEASEWTAADHPLEISARLTSTALEALCVLVPEVAAGGIVTLALVWSSSSSKRRGIGVRRELRLTELRGLSEILLAFNVPPGTLRGTVSVTARLFSAQSGTAGFAPDVSLILGDLAPTQAIVLDGSGGLVPTREESAGREAPLWRLEAPTTDEEALSLSLDSGVLALVLNRDHRHFADLKQASGEFSPLYWEVFAGWVTLLLLHFRPDNPADEERISSSTRLAHADRIPNIASFYSEFRKWLPDRSVSDAGEIASEVRKYIERILAIRRANGG